MMKKSMRHLFESRLATMASHAMGRAADLPLPRTMLDPLIRAYSFGFGVDLHAAQKPPEGYASFGDFFAREMKPGTRPICHDTAAIVSPCDGLAMGCGKVSVGAQFEIKGRRYDVGSLLGDLGVADRLSGGGFIVVYLHPRDYHRVHAPTDAELAAARHIPGARYPVTPWTTQQVEDVYGKNERLVFEFIPTDGGLFCVVMVAAFGVGGFSSPFSPSVEKKVTERRFLPNLKLDRGEELGAFRLGSTVVLLWSKDSVSLDIGLTGARMLVGRRIGRTIASRSNGGQE
ncbi:MAG: archaetidylserine decarboxylase [Myxococcota bacterium]|jgi:phosphatidylserine decarboxylase|nr:archaetidylserine decarboxylase [Myxococcota bacterium]